MAKAANKVIAGDYNGKAVSLIIGTPNILISFGRGLPIEKTTIEQYELIMDEHRKSATSGVARGIVGGVLLGPVGMLAGGLSAKNKGIYQMAIQFKDGKKSLIEVDDKIYKAIIKLCF